MDIDCLRGRISRFDLFTRFTDTSDVEMFFDEHSFTVHVDMRAAARCLYLEIMFIFLSTIVPFCRAGQENHDFRQLRVNMQGAARAGSRFSIFTLYTNATAEVTGPLRRYVIYRWIRNPMGYPDFDAC